jgi:hypothetical protein
VCKECKGINRRVENVRIYQAENEKKAASLMSRNHLINLVEESSDKPHRRYVLAQG